jgi:hypothetical protein
MKGNSGMSARKTLAAVIALGLAVTGCDYIVPPIDFSTAPPALSSEGWSGFVTNVADANGALHVDLSIKNDTNDWSAMDVGSSVAKVTDAAGKTSSCATVFVGTSSFVNNGGWFLAPGFQMKGYTGGSVAKPTKQMLYVECAGVAKAAGEKLAVDYAYITGAFNYYTASQVYHNTLKLDLDKVVSNAIYPVGEKVASLKIETSSSIIPAINDCTVQLTAVKRTDTGFEFSWESTNPGKDPTYVHIGQPPVLGADGVLYGVYVSPHLSNAPITPNGGKATWTTTASVPKDVSGFYILLPVETKQQKYFVDHVVDITDK